MYQFSIQQSDGNVKILYNYIVSSNKLYKMPDTETVETALIKILDRALAISDNEICRKIPQIVEKRSEYIVDNVIKDLRKKSEQLKKEMVKRFREDIKKSLSRDMSVIANEYKQIFFDLTDNALNSKDTNPGNRSKGSLQQTTTKIDENAQRYADSVRGFANNGKGDPTQRINASQPIIVYMANEENKKTGMASKIGGALKTIASPFVALGKLTVKVTWVVTKTAIGAIATATAIFAAANPIMFIALIGAIQKLGPEGVAQLTVENAPKVFEAVTKGIESEGQIIELLTKYGPEAKQFIDTCSPLVQSGGEEFMKVINSPEFLEATTVSSEFIKEYGPEFLDAAVSTGEFLEKFSEDPSIIDSFPEIAAGSVEFGAESMKEAALNTPEFLSAHSQEIKSPSAETMEAIGDNVEDIADSTADAASSAAALAKDTIGDVFSRGGKRKKRATGKRLSKIKNTSFTKHPRKHHRRTIKKYNIIVR